MKTVEYKAWIDEGGIACSASCKYDLDREMSGGVLL